MGMNSIKKAYRQSRPFFEGRRRHSPSYRRAVAQWNEIARAFNRIGGEPARLYEQLVHVLLVCEEQEYLHAFEEGVAEGHWQGRQEGIKALKVLECQLFDQIDDLSYL